jgi:hypothetical protein
MSQYINAIAHELERSDKPSFIDSQALSASGQTKNPSKKKGAER